MTFLLNHRLHLGKLMPYLRRLVQTNMPLVAFSAGTVLCGPDILTSRDLNSVGTPYFESLKAVSFNFLVHYGGDAYLQAIHDNWLADYHVFWDDPVIMMSDNAYVKVEGKKISLERGDAWILRKGRDKEKIELGEFG
ncbi:MAG: Type 1 glutamine amidotransferase-like domain-containing protein [Chloroflexota bacterium]